MSKISNKFLAQAPTLTLKGNNTGGTANVTDLTVSQVQTMLGLTIGTWAVYTPTITGYGTVSSAKGTYRQVGDSLYVKLYFVAGTVTSTLASFSLPGGFTLSSNTSTKLPISNTTSQSGIVCGSYVANTVDTNLTNAWMGPVLTAPATSTSLIYVGITSSAVGSSLIPAAANKTCESTSTFSLECELILA